MLALRLQDLLPKQLLRKNSGGPPREFYLGKQGRIRPITCHYVGAPEVRSMRNYASLRITKLNSGPSQHWEFCHWIQWEQGQTVREVHLCSKEIESSISHLLEFSGKTSCINIGRVTERQVIRSVTPFRLVWQLHLFHVKLISTVIWGDEVYTQYCNLEDLYKAKSSFIHFPERIIKVHFWYHQ